MKKSVNINMNGRIYCFDEDALELVERYISKVTEYYRGEGDETKGGEYEKKIASMLQERVGSDSIVTIQLIRSILNEVELPLELSDAPFDSEDNDSEGVACPGPGIKGEQYDKGSENSRSSQWRIAMRLGNKLYRDPNDKLLGGVISGLAKYNGWSIGISRLIVMLIFLLGLSFGGSLFLILAYALLWLVLPKACNIIDLTRMRKLSFNDGADVETAWKDNYELALGELTYPKSSGCLASAVKIIFFVMLAMISFPLFFAFLLLLFVLAILFFVLVTVFGVALFENVYVLILLLMPLFALIHWILKKCNVCSPLNRYVKIAFVLGWLATLGIVCYNIHNRVEANGGWESIVEEIVDDRRFFDEKFWEQLIEENVSAIESHQYVAWGDGNGNLPFTVQMIRYNLEDKVILRFYEPSAARDVSDGNGFDDDSFANIEVAFFAKEGALCFVWDSIASEILVDNSDVGNMSIYSKDKEVRYINPGDSISYSNALEMGKIPFKICILKNALPAMYIFGNDTIDGVYVTPVAQHYSYKGKFFSDGHEIFDVDTCGNDE